MIKKPMKAPSTSITDEQLDMLPYPVYGSVKLDGYRCTTMNGAFTSSMKKITNDYIQGILSQPEYSGLDGELIVGAPNDPDVFNNTTGPVRRKVGEPDFTFYVFDNIACDLSLPYGVRLDLLNESILPPGVQVLEQKLLGDPQAVIDFTQWCVDNDYEGGMIRTREGRYKQGRCTFKEMNIFKRKPVEDDECVVIGFEEQMLNGNEVYTDELGLNVRSAHKENKVGKGTLGALVVKSALWDEPFAIGTGIGLTDNVRKYIWDNQNKFMGSLWTYKYQKYGSINAPRQPIAKGMRDINDITKY